MRVHARIARIIYIYSCTHIHNTACVVYICVRLCIYEMCVCVCIGSDSQCYTSRRLQRKHHRIATYKTGACSLEGAKYIHDHKTFFLYISRDKHDVSRGSLTYIHTTHVVRVYACVCLTRPLPCHHFSALEADSTNSSSECDALPLPLYIYIGGGRHGHRNTPNNNFTSLSKRENMHGLA